MKIVVYDSSLPKPIWVWPMSFPLFFHNIWCMRNNAVYRKISCIYFLFLRGKLIYIGQTTDLIARMGSHHYEHLHDCIRWIPCPIEKLEEYEKRLIKILKPLGNWAYSVGFTSRIKFNYRYPVWLSFYKKIRIYTKALKEGLYRNLSLDTIKENLRQAKAKFRRYYRRYGYDGTFLDTTINHPI